ncbi:MAG: glycosyltransferase [Methanoculleaceae archaeon]
MDGTCNFYNSTPCGISHCLEDYRQIAGDRQITDIYRKARKLFGHHILAINSTAHGGGVAEMLTTLIPLMNEVGVDIGWRILHGNADFFMTTKKFHNALQGDRVNFTSMKQCIYLQTLENFSRYTHIDHDCVLIHDPQPLALIRYYRRKQPWIWRCHLDISNPNPKIWNWLLKFILRYDLVILSSNRYIREDLPVEQVVCHPAIDPLSPKNIDISGEKVTKYLAKFNIPIDKPIIAQISRFDRWKNPEGVIEIFKRVKKEVDCRLVLCGSAASDDPESSVIYDRILRMVQESKYRDEIILVTSENDIMVNALQRTAKVIIQRSLREGFGLTVTEALWKGTPVVASDVGGIPLQITDGYNGYLVNPKNTRGFADRTVELLQDPDMAAKMGENGKKHVHENFLLPRLVEDYLDIFDRVLNG